MKKIERREEINTTLEIKQSRAKKDTDDKLDKMVEEIDILKNTLVKVSEEKEEE